MNKPQLLAVILVLGALTGTVIGTVASTDIIDSLVTTNTDDTDPTDQYRNESSKTENLNEGLTRVPRNETKGRSPSTYNSSGVTDVTMPRDVPVSPDRGWFVDSTSEENLILRDDRPPNELGGGLLEGGFGIGVYVSDTDEDMWEDLLVISSFEPVLFENNRGQFEKSDALPQVDVNVTSALFFDYDNDGWEDLYLLSDEESVFLENVRGEFTERDVGLDISYDSVRTASAADYTQNGCLDVFVLQAGDWQEKKPAGYYDSNVSMKDDNGNRNLLFRGDCEGFEEATQEAGIKGESWSLATSFVDLTNDGLPDIHVANDFNNDVVYINNGDGTFDRHTLPEFTDRNGMSSEVADINGDGHLDIFVSNIHYSSLSISEDYYEGRVEGNNLLINMGNGTFKDHADRYGVKEGGWGWATLVEDFDNNGYLDIYQTTGTSTFFWKNSGSYTLADASVSGIEPIPTMAAASFDHDMSGELDIIEAVDFINKRWGKGVLRFNENNFTSGSAVQIDITPGRGETAVLGTEVRLDTDSRETTRVLSSRTDYLSQSSRILHFGVKESQEVVELRVEWSDGDVHVYNDVKKGYRIKLSPEGIERKQKLSD